MRRKSGRNAQNRLALSAARRHTGGNLRQVEPMLHTIRIGKHISAQGMLVRRLANGMVVIRVGQSTLAGHPISKRVA
jgi:hypothetical protein